MDSSNGAIGRENVRRSTDMSTKNPAAVALGRLRAARGDMAAVARLGGLAARGKGGRKPSERCACGQMTLARAVKRNHKCSEVSHAQ